MNDKAITPMRSPFRGACLLLHTGFYIGFFVFAAAMLVIAVRIPPILDFPNHFARIFLISGGIDQPFFSNAYALDWSRARTNIGIDLLAYWIGPMVGPDPLARSLLFLAIVLPPLGAIALNRRLFGGGHPFHIAILFLAWSTTLIGGFINFQIGLGLALLFAVVDLKIGQRRLILINLWRIAACLVLTLDHIFAAGFYLVLSAGLELPSHFRDFADRRVLAAKTARIALAGIAGLTSIAALILSAEGLPGDEKGIGLAWNSPLSALSNFLSAISSYFTLTDVVLFIPILIIVIEARSRRQIRFHAGLLIATSFLLVLSMVAPRHAMGTGWISWRFPIMTLLTAAAAICPFPGASGRIRGRLVAASAATVFLRTAFVACVWWQGNQDAVAVQNVLADLPPGSKVLPISHFPAHRSGWQHANRYFFQGEDTIRHLPILATLDAGAFVPTLFTAIGKQPLQVIGEFRSMAIPEGNLLSPGALFCPNMQAFYAPFTPYLADWRQKFDYLLVINADLPDMFVGSALPSGLKEVANASFAALYAMDKTGITPRFGAQGECPAAQAAYPN
jgi:hypothetical protein